VITKTGNFIITIAVLMTGADDHDQGRRKVTRRCCPIPHI